MNDIDKLKKDILEFRKKENKITLFSIFIIGIPLLLFNLTFLINRVYGKFGLLNVIITIVLMILIIINFVLKSYLKKCENELKENYEKCLQNILHKSFGNCTIKPKEYIEPSKLREIGLIGEYSDSYGSNLLNINDEFIFSNLELWLEKDDEVKTLKGQVYIFPYKNNIPGSIRILTSETNILTNKEYLYMFEGQRNNEYKIELESIEFNKHFEVFSTDEHYTFYSLSPKLMEFLLELRKKYNRFSVVLEDNYIYLMIETRKKLLENTIYKNIESFNEESIKNDILSIMKFFEFMQEKF